MQETIELFQATPKMSTFKTKFLHFILSNLLTYGSWSIALLMWWQGSWWMGLLALLLSHIIEGIVESKLMHAFIPMTQHEFTYKSKDIAAWVVHFYFKPLESTNCTTKRV